MKTRTVLFLAISALLTLSFTFASVNHKLKAKPQAKQFIQSDEPIGGLGSEDKISN